MNTLKIWSSNSGLLTRNFKATCFKHDINNAHKPNFTKSAQRKLWSSAVIHNTHVSLGYNKHRCYHTNVITLAEKPGKPAKPSGPKKGKVEFAPDRPDPPEFPNAEIPDQNPPGPIDVFSERVESLAEQVVNLNMVEMMHFMKSVSRRLGISFEQFTQAPAPQYFAPPPGFQAPSGQVAGGTDAKIEGEQKKEEPKEVKNIFTVKLVKLDDGAKYKVLKEIRTLKPGMSVTDSKKFVDTLPSVLAEGTPKDEADKWVSTIKAAGGVVELS